MIMHGEIDYDDAWRGLSDECSDFVRKLLTRDAKERMSSREALGHPWMAKNREVIFAGGLEDTQREVQVL